jgi:LacI family transcriptional regulator
VPNVHARALASGASRTIGLIVADNSNPYYARVIRGVEVTARERGYAVLLCNTDEQPVLELAAHQLLREKGVDGVLITSVQSGAGPLRELEHDGTPFVLLNRYLPEMESDCVLNDNFQGAYEVTTVLCRLGHRRIAHLTGSERISSVRDRTAGYRQALQDFGIPFDPSLIVRCDLRFESGDGCIRSVLLAARPKVTAVFAYSDMLAISVLKAARELQMQVPEDLALVGYDDLEFSEFIEPPLTTVSQQAYNIGRQGTEILLGKVTLPDEETWVSQRIVLRPELRIRASSGAPLTS